MELMVKGPRVPDDNQRAVVEQLRWVDHSTNQSIITLTTNSHREVYR